VILDAYWCPVHGRRTTAALDPRGLLRCDAPVADAGRARCELLLEPVIVPDPASDVMLGAEGADDDEVR
jgi:hypothetical protein